MNHPAFRLALVLVVASLAASARAQPAAAPRDRPARRAEKGCTWEERTDATVGLSAWFQRCDFGFRKIDFVFQGTSLAVRYSDGGAPEPLVDVLPLQPGETAEAGLRRIFAERTDKAVARRCVLAPFRETKTPAGVTRYTFVPDPAYARELAKKASPDEVPEPPCGDFGESPDGTQYFEVQPASGARRVLFVRAGQDEPLFDTGSLRLLPAR